MSYFEYVSGFIALVALVVSFVSFVRTTRLQKRQTELQHRQTELQEVQARLAARELAALAEEAKHRALADVRIRLLRSGRGERFVIENHGPATALDVDLIAVVPVRGEGSPIPKSEIGDKLPIRSLPPGDSVSLIAGLRLAMGTTFEVTFAWATLDGPAQERKQRVSLA